MQENLEELEKSYFTIGEVAKELNVSVSLLRFWETEFTQIKPRKTAGGTRKYSLKDLQTLKQIYQLLKIEGYTIPGAKDKLKEKINETPDIESIKIKLVEIKNFLVELKNNLA